MGYGTCEFFPLYLLLLSSTGVETNEGVFSWACAVPTAFATVLILMREMIYAWFVRVIQRKRVLSNRKRNKAKRKTR